MSAEPVITGSGKANPAKVALSMQDKVELQFIYLKKTYGDLSNYTIKVTLNGLVQDYFIDTTSSDSAAVIRVAVGAANMRATYVFELYDAQDNLVSKTHNVCVEAYAKSQLGGTYNDVAVGMMRYGDAITAFLAG
jgi:hypothetical protein